MISDFAKIPLLIYHSVTVFMGCAADSDIGKNKEQEIHNRFCIFF